MVQLGTNVRFAIENRGFKSRSVHRISFGRNVREFCAHFNKLVDHFFDDPFGILLSIC